jgi:hypothetical protein
MLIIDINWEFFLGILGTLIALSYYANGRLTRIETNFEWLQNAVRDLSIRLENFSAQAFDIHSSVSLTATGEQLLRDSGLKSYIDRHRDHLTSLLHVKPPLEPHLIQDSAFRLFDRISFDGSFGRRLHKFAYASGTSMQLLRRVGAIYLRDIAVAPR